MSKALFLFVPALFALYPIQSLAQDLNSWGSVFDCAVDWFSQCKTVRENRADEPSKLPAARANSSSFSGTSNAANLPLPVKNVLENPSREASEKLAKASEYIAQATRGRYFDWVQQSRRRDYRRNKQQPRRAVGGKSAFRSREFDK